MSVRGISLVVALLLATSACADLRSAPARAGVRPAASLTLPRLVIGPGFSGTLTAALPGALPGAAGSGEQELAEPERRRLDRSLRRYLADRPGRAAVAVLDRTSGTRYAFGDRHAFMLASVAKVDILLALLLRAHHGLSDHQRRLAVRMIRYSDNDCAHVLYEQVGGAEGLTRVLRRLGIQQTLPQASWGTSLSRPSDQVKVLDRLTGPDGPITAAERRFALGLMASVTPEQAWGVSAAAPRGRVALKNGWLPASAHGGLWTVNSLGRLRTKGRELLMAVLSERSPTMESGVETVETLARLTARALTATAPL
jgi:hypothetical protein